MDEMTSAPGVERVRPQPRLLLYYVLSSLLLGPLFPLLLIPRWLRYRTLRYRFDGEAVSMRWGALQRRETVLSYERIQDLHVVSNPLERWLDLARIEVQTASGSSKAEMTIEGLPEPERVRDLLYERMRGAAPVEEEAPAAVADEAAVLVPVLEEIADEVRRLRRALEGRSGDVDG